MTFQNIGKSAGYAVGNFLAGCTLFALGTTRFDSEKVCVTRTSTDGILNTYAGVNTNAPSEYCLPQITNMRLMKPLTNIASSALKGNEAIGAPLTNITSLGLVVTSAIFFRNAIKHTKEFMAQVSKY